MFRTQVRQHSDAVGWLAGRRAWSAVRTLAVLDSDSVMRRTMRDVKATSGASGSSATGGDLGPEAEFVCRQEVERLRGKLWSEESAVAARGASLLLELVEPDTLDDALRAAFDGASAPREQQARVERAWDSYRHDRYRALN